MAGDLTLAKKLVKVNGLCSRKFARCRQRPGKPSCLLRWSYLSSTPEARPLRFLFALNRIVIPQAFYAGIPSTKCMIATFPSRGNYGRNLERFSYLRDGFHTDTTHARCEVRTSQFQSASLRLPHAHQAADILPDVRKIRRPL